MSNGSQIGAVAGGIVGGVAGYFVGMPALGFSIGWAAGGMIGGALDPPKDQVTDFGSQAFPDFNLSLRGINIPILFGTNRVTSNIVWQGNYQTVRTEVKNESGGKGGGSGGGSKGPESRTAVYTYKFDIVYHIGMTPEPINLIRIWNSGYAIDSSVVSAINQDGSVSFIGPDPSPDDKTDSTKLYFTDASYYSGQSNPTSGWQPLVDGVNVDVRWPYTAWLGFDELSMGSRPVTPQLSFEVGPDNLGINANANFLWKANYVNSGYWSGMNGSADDTYGNTWLFEGTIRVFDQDGNLIKSYGLTEICDKIIDLYYAFGSYPQGYTGVFFIPQFRLAIGGTKLLAMFTNGILPYTSNWGVFDILPGGEVVATGGVWSSAGIFGITEHYDGAGIHFAGTEDIDTTLVAFVHAYSDRFRMQIGRSINEMENVLKGARIQYSGQTFQNDLGYGRAFKIFSSWNGRYEYGVAGDASFVLPDASGNIWAYCYSAPGVHEPIGQLGTDRAAQRPFGGLLRFKIDMSYIPSVWAGSELGIYSLNNPEFVASPFVDESGATYDYFPDNNYDWATGSTSTRDVRYIPRAFTQKLSAGVWLVIFYALVNSDDEYSAASDHFLKLKLRAYIYRQDTGKFQEHTVGKYYYVRKHQVTGPTGSADPDFKQLYLKLNGNRLESWFIIDTYIGKADFGSIGLYGGADRTPPEIINEILVNPVFGMYPGQLIIDTPSYTEAVQYCQDNSIKVSCQYRNEGRAWDYIEKLLAIYDGFLNVNATNGTIKFGVMDLNRAPVRTIDNSRLLRKDERRPPVTTTKGAPQDTYNKVRVNYIDRDLEYKANFVEEDDEVDQDLNGVRLREFPGDFVMNGSLAARLANRGLWNNLYARDRHTFYLGWKDFDLEPGDVITLVDSFTNLNQVVQIARMQEVDRGVFECSAGQLFQQVPGLLPTSVSSAIINYVDTHASSSYTSQSSASQGVRWGDVRGINYARAYELPSEFETDGIAKIYVGWIPDGEAAGANLYVSGDGVTFGLAQQVSPYPISGRLLTSLPNDRNFALNVPVFLYPSGTSVESFDVLGTITDIDETAMHNGLGLLWVNSEMIAYHGATLISQNRYALRRVYRGWGGTPVGAINSGDRFWKHGGGIFSQDFTVDRIGGTFYYKVAPFDFRGNEYDVASISAGSYNVLGTFYRPPIAQVSQVNSSRGIVRQNVGSAGNIVARWPSGARQSGYGVGGYGKNPGGYGAFNPDANSIGWRVEVVGSGGIVVNSTFVTTPAFTYTNSQNFAQNGAWRGNIAIRVTPRNQYGDAPQSTVASLELFF